MSVRILIGDVIERLKELPDESVHCVVTSPPYWGLRDYGVDGQIGLEPTLGEHIAIMVKVFSEVRRVLRKDGTLWLNYGDCYATSPNSKSAAAYKADKSDDRTFRDKPFSTVGPIHPPSSSDPFRRDTGRRGGGLNSSPGLKPKDLCMVPNRLAIALQEDGWWVRSEIIWAKPNPMPESITDRPATSHEKIWLLSKSAKYYYDADAVLQACSKNTHARISQDLANQVGSYRANGGNKTNGPMKAVYRSRKMAKPGSGIKANESMENALALQVTERNLRNYEPAQVEVWNIATRSFSEAHFATFPPELAERCIKAGCPENGIVLDPFGGAMTTGMVADRLGRDAILIELNPEYAELGRQRINKDAGMFAKVSSC